jgi:hypothetical protein
MKTWLSDFFLGRLEEAQATIAEAHAKKLDTPNLHLLVGLPAFMKNDTPGSAQEIAWPRGSSKKPCSWRA